MSKKHLVENGPVTLTDANRLYMYALLRQAVGCGRQVFMPLVLEVLAEAGLTPENLGFESAEALFSKLADFCQLTTFKGGRHYVTVTPRADWDDALVAAEESKKPAGKGGKPWKRKKGAVKPVRPKTREPKPEPEPEPKPEVAAKKTAEPQPAPTEQVESSVEPAPVVEAAPEPAPEPQPEREPKKAEEPVEQAAPKASAEPATATTDPGTTVTIPSILEQIAAQTPAEPEPSPAAPEPQPAPEPTPKPATPAAADPGAVATAPRTRDDLPRSFADEVSVKPAILGLLTRLLPFDADINRVLDEDLPARYRECPPA